MAEAKLNFDESTLDTTSALYGLYSRLYEGMREANLVDAPDYITNPPLDKDGQIDSAAIAQGLANHSTVLMKNSAYMMANAIVTSVGDGSGSAAPSPDCLSRSGDSMAGKLSALYGFQAGSANKRIFETLIDSDEKQAAYIYGYLSVSDNLNVQGQLNIGDSGIFFSKQQSIFYKDNALQFTSQNIKITGDIEVDGGLKIGAVNITPNGILNGNGDEYYRPGNCNNSTTDWNAKNSHIYGDLVVDGTSTHNGNIIAQNGFNLGAESEGLLYSRIDEDADEVYIQLAADLDIVPSYGLKVGSAYIVKVRNDNDGIISFSAPGMIMNLGDSDGEIKTRHIALQTAITNYNSDYTMVSQYGDGNFPNSLTAGCANAGPTVLQTYYNGVTDCGVVFHRNIRLGTSSGPSMCAGDVNNITFTLPYVRVTNSNLQQTTYLPFDIRYQASTSLFRDQSKEWSASLNFNTDAEFFTFQKPVESTSFSIISEQYKTRLIENTLFFDDAAFIEGLSDGLRFTGNAYFSNNVSSSRFATGFAGYGWAIAQDKLNGGYAATFDELTVRKKMRTYETEVRKHSITNGALWVSDACSGDLVEEIA